MVQCQIQITHLCGGELSLPNILFSFFSDHKELPVKQLKETSHDYFSLAELCTDNQWKQALKKEFTQAYFKELEKSLNDEYSSGAQVFPPKELIFNALTLTPLGKVYN